MSDQSTVDQYQALATRLRSRIEFAESVMRLEAPTMQIVETVALQGRKAIETIAYMSLVVTEHGLGIIPPDVRTHWNAEKVFLSA